MKKKKNYLKMLDGQWSSPQQQQQSSLILSIEILGKGVQYFYRVLLFFTKITSNYREFYVLFGFIKLF